MEFKIDQILRCELKLRERLVRSRRAYLLGFSERDIDRLANQTIVWAKRGYAENRTGESLKQYTRAAFRERYGSIITMLLFSIVWEVIKSYLFEQK